MPTLILPGHARQATAAELTALATAYRHLLCTCEHGANNASSPPAPFGRELLEELGVEDDLLGWMLFQDHIDHWRAPKVVKNRDLDRIDSIVFDRRSFVTLTERGEHFAR